MDWQPRLVALDIDGTLIGHDGRLPRSVFDAVQRVVEAEVPVVLSTGRGWIGTQPLVVALQLPPGQHVSSNGAVRVSHPPLEVLERVTFDPSDVVDRVLVEHPEAMLIARLGQVTLAQIAADFDQRYAALLATGAMEPLTGH